VGTIIRVHLAHLWSPRGAHFKDGVMHFDQHVLCQQNETFRLVTILGECTTLVAWSMDPRSAMAALDGRGETWFLYESYVRNE